MRLAVLALAAALLVSSAAAYGGSSTYGFTQPAFPINTTVPTNKITNQRIISSTLQGIINLPGRIANGSLIIKKLGTPTEKVEVKDAGCLNTVIPPPLNWGPLYCPGREVKVMQWFDEIGTLHRSVDIPVQTNVTANMVLWLFSPLYPQFLEFNGKMWFWYHLWHPLDHIMAANTIGPSPYYVGQPSMYTLIHEHYRNPKELQGMPEWETDAWFHIEDMMSNFLKKRIVISINTVGLQAWTLIVDLKDTPKGLKIDIEQIIGLAAAGFDKADPSTGVSKELAQVLEDNIIKPSLEEQTPGRDFWLSANAITRHVVEEFSMFRFFLPQVWARYPHIKAGMDLTDGLSKIVPHFNYGPPMFVKPLDTTGLIDFLTPFNGTEIRNLTALHEALKATPAALRAGATLNLGSLANKTKADIALLGDALKKPLSWQPAIALSKVAIPSAARAWDVPSPSPKPDA